MGTVVDGVYVVDVVVPKRWTLAEVDRVISDQQARIDRANLEISEANSVIAQHQALRSEMVAAGVVE